MMDFSSKVLHSTITELALVADDGGLVIDNQTGSPLDILLPTVVIDVPVLLVVGVILRMRSQRLQT